MLLVAGSQPGGQSDDSGHRAASRQGGRQVARRDDSGREAARIGPCEPFLGPRAGFGLVLVHSGPPRSRLASTPRPQHVARGSWAGRPRFGKAAGPQQLAKYCRMSGLLMRRCLAAGTYGVRENRIQLASAGCQPLRCFRSIPASCSALHHQTCGCFLWRADQDVGIGEVIVGAVLEDCPLVGPECSAETPFGQKPRDAHGASRVRAPAQPLFGSRRTPKELVGKVRMPNRKMQTGFRSPPKSQGPADGDDASRRNTELLRRVRNALAAQPFGPDGLLFLPPGARPRGLHVGAKAAQGA